MDNYSLVFTQHFTKFTCVCSEESSEHTAMRLFIRVYNNLPEPGDDMIVRVYVGDDNPDNVVRVEEEASKLNSTLSDGERHILFHNNGDCVNVKVDTVIKDWECLNSTEQMINFFAIWVENRTESRTFDFEPASDEVNKFRCFLKISQGQFVQEQGAELCIYRRYKR
ncbi:uncharacterized protein LOC144450328 isoform X2 [Glandiceps talaboti]